MKKHCFLISVTSLFFASSCGPSKDTLKPTGDMVKISTFKGKMYEGELVSVQDSLIYLMHGNRIHSIQLVNTATLTVEGYANRNWLTSLLLFQGIPTILLAVAASSVDEDNGGPIIAVGGIATALVGLIFEFSTPAAPQGKFPFSEKVLNEIRKYSRIPQGLSTDQIQQLMLTHEQNEINELR